MSDDPRADAFARALDEHKNAIRNGFATARAMGAQEWEHRPASAQMHRGPVQLTITPSVGCFRLEARVHVKGGMYYTAALAEFPTVEQAKAFGESLFASEVAV